MNGAFGKWLGIVMAGLLIAGVGGVWKLSYDSAQYFGQLFTKVEGIERRLDQVEKIVIYRGPNFGSEAR